jgi:hypothetical protein
MPRARPPATLSDVIVNLKLRGARFQEALDTLCERATRRRVRTRVDEILKHLAPVLKRRRAKVRGAATRGGVLEPELVAAAFTHAWSNVDDLAHQSGDLVTRPLIQAWLKSFGAALRLAHRCPNCEGLTFERPKYCRTCRDRGSNSRTNAMQARRDRRKLVEQKLTDALRSHLKHAEPPGWKVSATALTFPKNQRIALRVERLTGDLITKNSALRIALEALPNKDIRRYLIDLSGLQGVTKSTLAHRRKRNDQPQKISRDLTG